MLLLDMYETFKLSKTCSIRGGATRTGPGKYSGGGHSFTYESDSTTWDEGSMEWTVCYYGIKTCAC